MSLTTDAAWNSAAAAPALGVLYLVELDFAGGVQRLTNWPLGLTALGVTWRGIGEVLEVGELRESEDGQYEKLDVGLSRVKTANVALALGAVETYQSRSARVWVALVDAQSLQITGVPILRFAGFMDQVKVLCDDGLLGKVVMQNQTGGYDVRSNPAALRLNQAQHSARHPGETGFRYLQDLVARPQTWLSKKFQQQ